MRVSLDDIRTLTPVGNIYVVRLRFVVRFRYRSATLEGASIAWCEPHDLAHALGPGWRVG